MKNGIIVSPNLDAYKRDDGTIDLFGALEMAQQKPTTEAQRNYLSDIVAMRPCKSRQLAAFIIATLVYFDQ